MTDDEHEHKRRTIDMHHEVTKLQVQFAQALDRDDVDTAQRFARRIMAYAVVAHIEREKCDV